jgi:glycosyltransferase involved in cell wall biosynthesis
MAFLKRKESKALWILFVGILSVLLAVYFLKTLAYWVRFHILARPFVRSSYIPRPVLEEDKDTFTWLIHMYPPIHNAGAEWMAHAMNQALLHDNKHVNVAYPKPKVHEFERVRILDSTDLQSMERALTHSSVLLTHLDMTPRAVRTAVIAKRPLVIVMHNNYCMGQLAECVRALPKNLYLIHNSYWIKDWYKSHQIPSIVVYPPVTWREYETETSREFVTLLNLNDNKGGGTLVKIAAAMPDEKFLGVKGAYGGQVLDRKIKNITYKENTANVKEIYAETGILLVPSKEESWGRVAVEAMSSGIPVIAHPTPGLVESCGAAGIFCDRNDTAAWVREIRRLRTDKEWYADRSRACKARAQELEPTPQLAAMSKWLSEIRWRD